MKIAVISITDKGRLLSLKIHEMFKNDFSIVRYCFEKNCDENAESFSDIKTLTKKIFNKNEALIFVCACGIAVRAISRHIVSKDSDPAVIVIDDCGKFVIPILSGHIGGANRLAEIIAQKINAVPTITTATDTGENFSPDTFAVANNLIITSLSNAKEIASAVLKNEKIGFVCDYPCTNIPSEVVYSDSCRTGIVVSHDTLKKPFNITLNLVPKNIVVGIGCKRGISCEAIEMHVFECLKKYNISFDRIYAVSTIDIKSDEKGLIEFCLKHDLKLFLYTADELMRIEGEFSKSEFVMKQTRTDNVCERSAVRCSDGNLIMRKMSMNGVTVALAEMPVEINFERKIL